MTVAGFAGLVLTLGAPHIIGRPIKAGDVAHTNLAAARSAGLVDEVETGRARERARQSVLPVFKRDHSLDRVMLDELQLRLDQVSRLQVECGLPLPAALGLTPTQQVYLLEAPEVVWQRIAAGLSLPARTTARPDRSASLAVRPEIETSIQLKLSQLAPAAGNKEADARQLGRPFRRAPEASLPAPDPVATIDSARKSYRALVPVRDNLSHDLLALAVTSKPQDWALERATIYKATKRLLQLGPLFPGVERTDWLQTVLEFLPDGWNENLRLTSARLISSVLKPNVVVDAAATRSRADTAADRVQVVVRETRAGQLIVPRGAVITPEAAETLKAVGISRTTNWPMVVSLCVSVVASFAFFGLFLYTYAAKHLFSPSSLGLMFTVSIVNCGVAAFVGHDLPQFVPLPAAAIILTIFFGPRVAIALSLLLMIFLRVDDLVDINNLIALGSAAGVAISTNIKQRKDVLFRGFLIGLMQAAGFLAAVIIDQSVTSAAALGQDLLLQLLGGLSSCIVAIGSLPFLENLFGMVTPFRIAELTASDQPLLRQLEENAPGTYQHSLAVANLAEAGARAIGADANLVRAGSMYHDIGKMVRPRFFIENQLGDKNPHDSISPEESRERVLAHVTDGIALAQKYAMPAALTEFIPMHQGTTLMAYFYHKACLKYGAENVDPNFYRYPGPKPQSRETAIVMLADVSEAVTHSMHDPTQEEVEAAISGVFKARWDDGQMSESGLTLDELERVKRAFVRVWRTLHHERLKYPATATGKMPVATVPAAASPAGSESDAAGELVPEEAPCDCGLATLEPLSETGGRTTAASDGNQSLIAQKESSAQAPGETAPKAP